MDDNKIKPDKEIERKKARQDRRKSNVRIWITYGAGTYIFVGSLFLIVYVLVFNGDTDSEDFKAVKDIFMLVFPIATGIITYWFSTRSNQQKNNNKEQTPPQGN